MAAECFRSYKSWVSKHSPQLNLVEQVLSRCLWLLPSRVSENESRLEGCRALMGLVRVCNDSIVSKHSETPAFTWRMALEAIQQVELLYEMRAGHLAILGETSKYTPLAGLELIKLFVRVSILCSSNGLITTTNAESGPQAKLRNPMAIQKAFKSLSNNQISIFDEAWYSASEKCEISQSRVTSYNSLYHDVIPEGSDYDNNLEDDSALEEECNEGANLWWNRKTPIDFDSEEAVATESLSGSDEFCFKAGRYMLLIGELFYLVRPIVCVYCLKRFGSMSWKPWCISLGMDLISRTLISQGSEVMKHAGIKRSASLSSQDQLLNYLTMVRNFQWAPAEAKEMKRRKIMFLMYLLRSPVFDNFTKPGLSLAQGVTSSIPLVGSLLGKALELLYGVQRYYVYTCGTW